MKITNKELIQLHRTQQAITELFKDDKEYGLNLAIDTFFLLIRNLNPQAYGNRAQKYFSNMFGYEDTASSLDRGDFKNIEGEHVEFKCSFLDELRSNINVKHIRLWQDLKFYYVFTVDFTDFEELIFKCYKLTVAQMNEECIVMKANPCHKTKGNHGEDEKVELGLSIKVGSDDFKRWEEKYLLSFNLKAIAGKRLEKIKHEEETKIKIANLLAQIESKDVEQIIDLEKELDEDWTIQDYIDRDPSKLELICNPYNPENLKLEVTFSDVIDLKFTDPQLIKVRQDELNKEIAIKENKEVVLKNEDGEIVYRQTGSMRPFEPNYKYLDIQAGPLIELIASNAGKKLTYSDIKITDCGKKALSTWQERAKAKKDGVAV